MNRDAQDVLLELLVIQAQSGDPRAAGRLADLLHRQLVVYAYRLLKDEQLAADIVQDTWLCVIRSLGRLNDPAAFRSWIFRIVYNKSMDSLRSAIKNREELYQLGTVAQSVDKREAEADEFDAEKIRRLIAELSPPDRALLALYYENGKSIREIALITSNTESSIKSKLYHLRQRLRAGMERQKNDRHEPT